MKTANEPAFPFQWEDRDGVTRYVARSKAQLREGADRFTASAIARTIDEEPVAGDERKESK